MSDREKIECTRLNVVFFSGVEKTFDYISKKAHAGNIVFETPHGTSVILSNDQVAFLEESKVTVMVLHKK